MLTHVVLFKLHDPETIPETVEVLRSLSGNVPTLRELEVGTDVIRAARSYDIALIARFDSLEGLQDYQEHPFHQGVLTHMRRVMSASVAVDFES